MKRNLWQVTAGAKVRVIDIQGDNETQFKLLGMGILPGDELTVLRSSFLGSPLSLKHASGQFFAIRKFQAEQISVE